MFIHFILFNINYIWKLNYQRMYTHFILFNINYILKVELSIFNVLFEMCERKITYEYEMR